MKVFALVALLAVAASAQQDCIPLRCQLPLKPGDCTESIASFYFDNTAKKCKPFTYTGCNGNVNRFRTLQLCENACLNGCTSSTTTTTAKPPTNGPTSAPPVRCTLKLDPGTCTSAIPRFYFDAASGQCKSFNYSGCGGNVNNFRSQELCEEICLGA